MSETVLLALVAAASGIVGGVIAKGADSLFLKKQRKADTAETITKAAVVLLKQQSAEITRLQTKVDELTCKLENAQNAILSMRERLIELERQLGKSDRGHTRPI